MSFTPLMPCRSRARRPLSHLPVEPGGGLILTVVVWEILGRSDPVLRHVLPTFSSVLAALGEVLGSPRLVTNTVTTGYEIAAGFGIGMALGLAAGLLVAASAFWHLALGRPRCRDSARR